MTPSIAIITPNTLMAMGLKGVLEDMSPNVDVLAFPSLRAFYTDCNRPFVHFFVADSILHLHENGHQHTQLESSHSQHLQFEKLSGREREVLSLMVKGFLNKEIADALNISVSTVIFHRNNICRKFGTRSIGRLTIKAVLAGAIDVNEI